MDRDDTYRSIVKRVLREVADMSRSNGNLRTEFVCDDTVGHYHVGEVGWEGKRRIDNVFVHVDVIDGKVWLQRDGTDLVIAEDLVRAGIPKTDIVLGFQYPARRPDTEYAVA